MIALQITVTGQPRCAQMFWTQDRLFIQVYSWLWLRTECQSTANQRCRHLSTSTLATLLGMGTGLKTLGSKVGSSILCSIICLIITPQPSPPTQTINICFNPTPSSELLSTIQFLAHNKVMHDNPRMVIPVQSCGLSDAAPLVSYENELKLARLSARGFLWHAMTSS